MLGIIGIGLGIILAVGAAILTVNAKTGEQETLGGAMALIGLIIAAVSFLTRVYGV